MSKRQWFIDGRRADMQALAALLDAARADKLKRSEALRKQRADDLAREIDHKKLGAAIRRAVREAEREARRRVHLVCQPLKGSYPGERVSRQFDDLLGLRKRRFKKPARDGLSSFHCKFTSRGLGDRRRDKGRPFRLGETVKHLRYIIRPEARELTQGGLSSNISQDPDELAAVFAALEDLERQDRANSNVYMSLIVSLPHELTPEGREQTLHEICQLLAVHGLPYVGVLHSPDKDGDPRNYHAHIMFSLRPIEVEGPGRYAFAAEKYSDLNDESFIKPFRHSVADILNAAMAREGHERRFTALSDADRGLAPRKKGSGKNSPGRTNWQRKQEELRVIEREQLLRADHGRALGRLKSLIAAVVKEQPRDLASELRKRRQGLAASLAGIKNDIIGGSATRIRSVAQRQDARPAQDPVARAQPAAVEPAQFQPRPDPEREAAIAIALERLGKINHPPLQRGAAGFRLDPTKVEGDLVLVDRFEADEQIRKAFDRAWSRNLDQLRIELDHAGRCPIVMGDEPEVVEGILADDLFSAYLSTKDDPEVQDLLIQVWRRWDERLKEKERKQAASLAAIRAAAKEYGTIMLKAEPKAGRDQLYALLKTMTDRFLAGTVGMRLDMGPAELVFAKADDRDLATRVLGLRGGRLFLEALGHAATDLEKRGQPQARLSLAVPRTASSQNPGREQDRGHTGKNGPGR